MESVWWALKQMWDKELIYEGRKVLMYCPRCETPLAKAEVAMDNSYKTVTEEAVTVKFKVKIQKKQFADDNTYLLAWTTTPWTLPGNSALAINEEIDYCLVERDRENYVLAKRQNRFFGFSRFAAASLRKVLGSRRFATPDFSPRCRDFIWERV